MTPDWSSERWRRIVAIWGAVLGHPWLGAHFNLDLAAIPSRAWPSSRRPMYLCRTGRGVVCGVLGLLMRVITPCSPAVLSVFCALCSLAVLGLRTSSQPFDALGVSCPFALPTTRLPPSIRSFPSSTLFVPFPASAASPSASPASSVLSASCSLVSRLAHPGISPFPVFRPLAPLF